MKKIVIRLIIELLLFVLLYGAFCMLASAVSNDDIISALVVERDFVPVLFAGLAFLLRLCLILLVPGALLYRVITLALAFRESRSAASR